MKKRAFTLLEIMIVILLITLISGTIGFSMKGTLEKGKAFRTEQAKEQLKDLLLICLAEGAKPEDIVAHPVDELKKIGLAKDPEKLVTDGWGELFEISFNASKTNINIKSKALVKYKTKKGKKVALPENEENDD